jgi:hypothetical protein
MATIQALKKPGEVCWGGPSDTPPSYFAIAEQFVSWIDDADPAVLDKPAHDSFFRAMRDAYPCPKAQQEHQ